jgi:rhodanese-related sulfurtransferase
MKRIVWVLVLLLGHGWAFAGSLNKVVATPEAIAQAQQNGLVLIDIRTPAEWQQTGLTPGAVPLQFFDANGQYDAAAFLASVEAMADKDTPIGIICRTANRSGPVAKFMAEQGWNVTDYQGGVGALSYHDYQPVSLERALADLEGSNYCSTPLAAC